MAKYASKVVEQAKSWLGYNEYDGSHKKIIDIYNAQRPLPVGYAVKYNDAWCATFVSAVAVKLGYTDIIPCECSCPRMITLFQKKGIWIEDENRTPNPGDIIFYDWQDNGNGDNKGSSDHVGIVEKVDGNYIIVIEGNYSNSVKRRTLSVNGKYIRGYGVPKYDVETKPTTSTTTTTSKPTDSKPTSTSKNTIVNGTVVSIASGAKYYNGKPIPNWVINKNWIVRGNPSGDRVIIDKSVDGKYSIYSAVSSKYLTVVSGGGVSANSNVIKKGSKVKVKDGAKTYTGGALASFVYKTTYTVLREPIGDRVVIGLNGVVTAAVNKKDLIIV